MDRAVPCSMLIQTTKLHYLSIARGAADLPRQGRDDVYFRLDPAFAEATARQAIAPTYSDVALQINVQSTSTNDIILFLVPN